MPTAALHKPSVASEFFALRLFQPASSGSRMFDQSSMMLLGCYDSWAPLLVREACCFLPLRDGLWRACVQVYPESTRSNLAQLLNERSQFFGAIADAWGKEAEYNRACMAAQQATEASEAMAMEVNELENELAERSAEACFMHERFADLVEQITDSQKVLDERDELAKVNGQTKELNDKLAAEVVTLTAELEAANEKVAEVESEAAQLWRSQREDQDSVCDLRMQLRAKDDVIADMQQAALALQVWART
ncbi:MAG: hypothetical protein HC767_03270 [Akkermansiaceae bacterium]|nr:hypothetical protein [Akkermansiaceae bacterium]